MPLKSSPMEEPALNMTPMIDIVFILLIFFAVGMQFSDDTQFDVQLPSTSQAQPLTAPPDEIVVTCLADGRVSVRGTTMPLADLEALLNQARERYADQAVLIRSDGQRVYQQVIDVLSICQKAKIKSFSLAASREEDASP